MPEFHAIWRLCQGILIPVINNAKYFLTGKKAKFNK